MYERNVLPVRQAALSSRADEFDLYLVSGVYSIVYITLTTGYYDSLNIHNTVNGSFTGQILKCIHVRFASKNVLTYGFEKEEVSTILFVVIKVRFFNPFDR